MDLMCGALGSPSRRPMEFSLGQFFFGEFQPMLRRVEWDDVRMLLALLRANNLHDAGARLGLDPSTVSRRLAALEHRLDQRLFARTRDGLRPTAAAERMRPYAETMEADAAACVRASAAQATRTSRSP